jgi:hypothetical protein
MTSIHDSSLFDDSFAMDFINYGDKIIYCAMYLYVGYVNEATNFAESQGGGGSDTKDWGREKVEDEIEWIKTMSATSYSDGKTKKEHRSKTVND